MTGLNPAGCGKTGSKHHVVTDAQGTPLVAHVTAANVHDGTKLIELIDATPRVCGKVGAPRRKPVSVVADKAYHSQLREMLLWTRGIVPLLPQRNGLPDTGLGRLGWVVEWTIAWLHQFRRRRIRYERRSDIHQASLSLAYFLICFRTLQIAFC